VCSSNDVCSRAEDVRLDLDRFRLRVEMFYDFPRYIKENNCAGDKIEKNEMGWACGAYG